MRKIINGRKYDTETAQCIDYCDSGYTRRDFKYYEETLYRKKTGEFFLCGEGGGLSKYAEYVPNCGYTYGENIIPLSEEEAMEWMERNSSVETYEEIWGEVEE